MENGQYRHYRSDEYINKNNNNNNNNDSQEGKVLLPQVASKSDAKASAKKEKKKGFQRFRPAVVSVISFFLHFAMVIGILFGGAMILAMIEDGDPPPPQQVMNRTKLYENFTRELKKSHDISLNVKQLESLMEKMKNFTEKEETFHSHEKRKDQKFIFLKWLYFAVITTTTIGYGDVYPRTDKGKIVTICFVVIGIILMMTLLARCGIIISATNKRFYGILRKYFCLPCTNKKRKGKVKNTDEEEPAFVSDELLSVISIHLIFIGFLFGGIWYGIWQGTNHWSYIDVIYYWFVTFTTCGYGDMTYSLDIEVENIFEHTVYRLFGLSLISAIIDAIASYINYRTELKKKVEKIESKIDEQVETVMETPSKCIRLKQIFRTKNA